MRSTWFVALGTCVASATPAFSQAIEYFDRGSFAAAASYLRVIDFDSLAPGDGRLFGTEYQWLGLAIIQRNAAPINVVQNVVAGSHGANFVTPANIQSGPNVISTSANVASASQAADDYDFVLCSPSSAAGLYVGNLGECVDRMTTLVEFLDGTGMVLASEVLHQGHAGVITGNATTAFCGGQAPFDNRIFYGITVPHPSIQTIRVHNGPFDNDGIVFDDIQFDDSNACCVFRNGSGVNAADFACVTRPVLGANWITAFGSGANTLGTILVVGLSGPGTGPPLPVGEWLISLALPPVLISGAGQISVPLPNDLGFIGFPISTQGLRIDVLMGLPHLVVLNAQDLILGL